MTKDFKNNRIKEIAKYIRPYKKIADVGCDHGYLIVEAFKNHEIDYAIAIDNKQGPLDSAKYNILKYGFNNNVRFSLSSGISDIDDDTEVVIIAGMGGLLINQIIKDDIDKLMNVKRLVIEANRNQYDCRKYLSSIGYYISDEEIVLENNKFYQIIIFEKNNELINNYSEQELLYGPILLKERKPLFIEMLKDEYNKLLSINNHQNIENVYNKIKLLKGIINDED